MSVLDSPDARPARVIEIRDESVGLDAVVVIDHELFGKSAGGTRMIPDVTEEEVARLARAMTWKLAVAHVPYAGAKAGIRFSGGDRAAILAAYFARIAEIDGFLTGPDMGTSPDDFEHGHSDGSPPLWAQSFEGMHMDDLAVGRGILGATRAALARIGRPLEDAAIAIEGFGKAGAGTAKAMHDAGARVVAVSTIEGALVDPDGLDVPLLLGLRREHGDRLVHEAGLEVQPREALFGVECDVLVPGARPDVITAGSASTLRAAAVVPAANIPYADGAVEALHDGRHPRAPRLRVERGRRPPVRGAAVQGRRSGGLPRRRGAARRRDGRAGARRGAGRGDDADRGRARGRARVPAHRSRLTRFLPIPGT